jgi:REP element-mobilizing transposase RayT
MKSNDINDMANTYTQLHHQFVFATKFREHAIHPSWKEELHKYITSLVQTRDHKMLQINTMPDHLHMLIGMRPKQSISSLIQIVKSESSTWIKERGFARGFAWQDGFGAFSYAKKDIGNVILYIQQQEEHHRKIKFRDEYIHMLNEAEIPYEDKYLFHDPI